MRITRTEIAEMVFPYAVSVFDAPGGRRVVVGTETRGECIAINPLDLSHEVVWRDMGGTMNICQLNPRGDFLAVQEFYKGNNSKTACLVHVTRGDGGWQTRRFLDLPFVHRFCLVDVGEAKFVVASTLAKDKANREDWSQPGATYVMRLPGDMSGPGELVAVIDRLGKNHGMWKGTHQGKNVVLVSGVEGVYEIPVPETPDQPWRAGKILDKEVSDMAVFDIDSDGVEEIITIEKFHGHRLVVNQPVAYGWREAYSYPIDFGHVVWAGNILGKPSILVGYRGDNAALVMLRPDGEKDGCLRMKPTFIDEHEAPTNIDVIEENGVFKIFNCSSATNKVILYELTE